MSPGRQGPPLHPPGAVVAGPPGTLRTASGYALGVYLAALTVPGLGSTLVWAAARAWARDPTITAHYRRALGIQLSCLSGMATVQVGVAAALGLGFPGTAPPELRQVLVLAGLHLTSGLYLVMGLLGPVLLVAERRELVAVPVSTGRLPPNPPSSARQPPTGPSQARRTAWAPGVSTRRIHPG